MRNAISTLIAVLSIGCATTYEQPHGTGDSQLSPSERAAAESAVGGGDVAISILGADGADYVGSAIIGVHTGDHPWVDLSVVGINRSQPSENFGGDLIVPEQYAYSLASTGWNFTTVRPTPDDAPVGLGGLRLHAALVSMTMHADPNGMFFATLDMRDAESGDLRTVTLTGRLTGGCDANTGGAVTLVGDPATIPACANVLGGL